MHELVQAVVFVAAFAGLVMFFTVRRLFVRFYAFLALVFCLMYYLFQLKVL